MKEFIGFLLQHWVLSSLFIVMLLIVIVYELREKTLLLKQVTPQKLVLLTNQKNAVIIDVRPKEVFLRGHITDAKNIPIATLKSQLSKLDEYKNKPIILVSESGELPFDLAQKLRKIDLGVQPVLLGGGINAWKNAGLPLIT